MSFIKRRQFLQFAGSVLATLGISQLEIEQQAVRYAQVLAQNTPRKRALLVGINDYLKVNDFQWYPLEGAVNDTQIQKELLINLFGFQSDNICILHDKEATRENILQAFEEHLIKWAQPGDVVVFHYSGHGSQVADPDKIFEDGRVSTIVPINSYLPPGYPNKGGKVDDITGHTLWLLMQAINTENVTFVLDSCYSGGARKGILTVRSRPGDQELLRITNSKIQLLASTEEQEYQKQLMSRLNLSNSDFVKLRQQGVPKGVMLAAAKLDQSAIDTRFADTPCGIFTYILTRYLWQQTSSESVDRVMLSTIATTEKILQEYFPTSGIVQQPEFNVKQGSNNDKQIVYFTNRKNTPAEAVVTKVQGNQIDLFLGGIDPRSLKAFGRGATFTVVDSQGQEQGQIQIESRQQLKAQGKLIQTTTRGAIGTGTLLQERSRAIPTNLTLDIGLDPSLRKEIEQAKQALQSIKRIQPVLLSKQEVQYILGRITKSYYEQLQKLKVKNLPQVGSIALFSPAQDLIPSSTGVPEEKITDAVKRLQPKLKSLLAARIVKLTLNTTSSKLAVSAAMQKVDGSQIVAESFTVRGGTVTIPSRTRGTAPQTSNAQKMQPGTEVQFLVANNEARELYIGVLLISVDGELTVLSPLPGNEDVASIPAKQEVQIPDRDRGEKYKFKIGKDPGTAEVLVIASTTPLTKAIQLLQTLAAEKPEDRRGLPVELNQEPAEAIANLLDDLDEGSRRNGTVSVPGIRQIDTRQMAALSITFEVIA
ncbi:MAG: caspase family protein [Nostoc sp. ChiSLP02]|nr:caspase family protein [Nostoc sp. DedSLP01]MDZ8185773.1 caspase family protein [Nostoc sp. ChiSLP02]